MLDREVLQAAATWYVNLSAAPDCEQERRAWRNWLAEDVRHAQAWTQVEHLQQRLGLLTPDLALPTLADVRARRRAVNKVLGLLLMAGAGGASLLAVEPLSSRLAEYRTAKGERRELQLADGSQLILNTDSAVDVDYGSTLREIRLHRGELLLQTARDPANRPLLVHTAQGSVRALGTRFSVYSHDGRSEVRVFEHAVEIRPGSTPALVQRVEAGQQAAFDSRQVQGITPLAEASDAWTRGMLMAVDWPLPRLLAELGRYRPGYLGCAEELGALKVTGAFRLDNSDAVLAYLASALPIRVRYLTRYWVRLEAA